jgi:hypothetical protein
MYTIRPPLLPSALHHLRLYAAKSRSTSTYKTKLISCYLHTAPLLLLPHHGDPSLPSHVSPVPAAAGPLCSSSLYLVLSLPAGLTGTYRPKTPICPHKPRFRRAEDGVNRQEEHPHTARPGVKARAHSSTTYTCRLCRYLEVNDAGWDRSDGWHCPYVRKRRRKISGLGSVMDRVIDRVGLGVHGSRPVWGQKERWEKKGALEVHWPFWRMDRLLQGCRGTREVWHVMKRKWWRDGDGEEKDGRAHQSLYRPTRHSLSGGPSLPFSHTPRSPFPIALRRSLHRHTRTRPLSLPAVHLL